MAFADGVLGHTVYSKNRKGRCNNKASTLDFLSAAREGEWLEGFGRGLSCKW